MTKRPNSIWTLGLLICIYLLLLAVFNSSVFNYRFDPGLIEKYFRSQSITHEVVGNRIFLSDSDVYIATGWLYVHGEDPSVYNFEHPPVLKYIFGLSTLISGNPLLAQVMYGIVIIMMLYFLVLKLSGSSHAATLSVLLLIIDPMFRSLAQEALLDLGQTAFLLMYFCSLIYGSGYLAPALLLAFFVGTKFWMTPAFFVFAIGIFLIYTKKKSYKDFFKHIFVAMIIYPLFYARSFVERGWHFNFVWHTLKMAKYWFEHSVSSYPGASAILLISGWYRAWWGDNSWYRSPDWNFLWPLSMLVATLQGAKDILSKKINHQTLVYCLPILYLLYLGVATPFTRYFVILLPFLYAGISIIITSWFYKLLRSRS